MSAVGAWDSGVLLVTRHFWEQLGLQAMLDSAPKCGVSGELPDRALALIANRLCEPTNEHGIARWPETDYVCDRSGRRWLTEWRNEAERLASRRPRVRVKDRQLRQWYGTLDRIVAQKKAIEKEIENQVHVQSKQTPRPQEHFHPETLQLLETCGWPRNVRELRNEIERLVLLTEPEEDIVPEVLSDHIRQRQRSLPLAEGNLKLAVQNLEEGMIRTTMARFQNNKSRVARTLGISRQSLLEKPRRMQMSS